LPWYPLREMRVKLLSSETEVEISTYVWLLTEAAHEKQRHTGQATVGAP
jgi:hypothetical protein